MKPKRATSPSLKARLWEAVDELVPGTLITETEADAYVAGTLPPERLAEVERLLAENPEFARTLRRARNELGRFLTPEKRAETMERLRKDLRNHPTPREHRHPPTAHSPD